MHEGKEEQDTSSNDGQRDPAILWAARIEKHREAKKTSQGKASRYQIRDSLRESGKVKWKDIGPDRIIELALTAAIAFLAAVQLYSTISNNNATGNQTDQLISAAKFGAYASQQNAQAGRDFAGSAKSIDNGISDAVEKLNIQAAATNVAAEMAQIQSVATKDLAAASRQSAETADKALEREIALDRAFITVESPAVEERGPVFDISAILENSGRTLATHARYTLRTGSYKASLREMGQREIIQTQDSILSTNGGWTDLPELPAV